MSIRMGRGIRTVVALVALGCAALLAFARSDTAQGAGECPKGACVIIVEVDGLEPKDVTLSSTPVMWALAHPDMPGATSFQGSGRQGYTWQAGRGVVDAGTAPAATSLLTGGYPEQTNVPADEYQKDGADHVWIGDPNPAFDPKAVSLLSLAQGEGASGALTAAYSGDPGLGPFANDASQNHSAYPGSAKGGISGDPELCPIPRTPTSQGQNTNNCDADDAQVLQAAQGDYSSAGVSFEYVHLAEIGRIKQQHGDVDQQGQAQNPAVAQALKSTDAALGTFIGQINQNNAAKWSKTTVFVVGNHGYETTPIAQRVPDPDVSAPPNSDLGDYIQSKSGDDQTVTSPQGTVATVYAPRDVNLGNLRQDILDINSDTRCTSSAAGKCIAEVLYTNPTTADEREDSVATKHPDWHAIPRNANGTSTGSGGDLLVAMAPGWAAGRATSAPSSTANLTEPKEATNPYEASSGGPRNRAIAAFVNGPGVKPKPFNEDNGRAPVTQGPDDGRATPDPAFPDADPIGVSAANANPDDDANAVGHERQLETPDIALTAAALMGLAVDPDQIGPGARILNEAFPGLRPPSDEQVVEGGDPPPEPPPEPPPPPPPPPPPVELPPIQVEQPPPPEGFTFHGLIRNLKAGVTDDKGNAVTKAKPGADLSYIQLTADFGKPQAQVSLTFYRNAKAGGGKSAKRRKGRGKLKAVVHFKPFKVQRGPAKIKLQVPARFAPDHVGVIVQEVREVKTPPKERLGGNGSSGEQTNFEGFGPKDGGIVAIADSNKLHTKARASKGSKRGR